jgi:hypothetical protein
MREPVNLWIIGRGSASMEAPSAVNGLQPLRFFAMANSLSVPAWCSCLCREGHSVLIVGYGGFRHGLQWGQGRRHHGGHRRLVSPFLPRLLALSS